MWMVGLTVEIKLPFQISPARLGRGVRKNGPVTSSEIAIIKKKPQNIALTNLLTNHVTVYLKMSIVTLQ